MHARRINYDNTQINALESIHKICVHAYTCTNMYIYIMSHAYIQKAITAKYTVARNIQCTYF